jgi:glycosyltransferase involved in cell wall biosynthesis
VQCLAEEKKRFQMAGKLFPNLMKQYWKGQVRQIKAVQGRLEVLKTALNTATAIISPSRFLMNAFVQAGVRTELIHYSRQGRDFPPMETNGEKKRSMPFLRLGYLGQIVEIKGVHLLVEALRQVQSDLVTLSIFGDVERFPKYAAKLRKSASGDRRISFMGAYSAKELNLVMDQVDVIIVPSLWYENSPNTILEAFGYRIPVIASNIGGMSELIQHRKNGLLFEVGNSRSLADQIKSLLDEPSLLDLLSIGIEPVKNTNQEIDELEQIYLKTQGKVLNIGNASHKTNLRDPG